MTIISSDAFARANGAIGNGWTLTPLGNDAYTIASNEAVADIPGHTGCSYLSGFTYPANGYAEVTIGTVVDAGDDVGFGPAYRLQTAATSGYIVQVSGVESRLYKVVAGSYTQLGSDGPSGATGNKFRIICNGTSISVQKNGSTVIGPVTDATFATGEAGMWSQSSGTQMRISLFEAGDLNAGSTFPPVPEPSFVRSNMNPILAR